MLRRTLLCSALLCSCAATPADTDATDATDATASTGTTDPGAAADPATTEPTGAPTTGPGTDSTAPTATDPTGDGAVGCDGVPLLPLPDDPAERGPWPVGARAGVVDGLGFEVWYPAEPGSEAGATPLRYDIRTSLPDSEQAKVPDDANPWQDCDCYRDLPVDAAHGPYPAVLFVHGTAGFRSQSLEHMTHWASRGFVVVAADHPGLWLHDLLGALCGEPSPPQDLGGDLDTLGAALAAPAGDLAFLAGRVDATRLAMSGHSAGGAAVEGAGATAQVVMPMAAGGVTPGAALRSVLVLGAQSDQVVAYDKQVEGYAASPAPKRLVGIADAGHLAFSSLCSLKNAEGQDFLTLAEAYDVCGAAFAGALFDCKPEYTPDPTSWAITNYATAAALEETLHCRGAGDRFAGLQARFPEVGEFQEEL